MRNPRLAHLLSVLVGVFASVAFGGVLPSMRGQSSNQGAVQTAVLQGTVIGAGSGQPLKRARVNLRRVGAALAAMNLSSPSVPLPAPVAQAVLAVGNTQAVTDDTGRYVFNGVAPGQYRISVDRDGYIHQEFGQRSFTGPGTVITVNGGQRITNVDFQMVAAGSISGRILNEDGEPMAGLQVQAQMYTYQQGRRVLTQAGQAGPTNDLGEYRIYWLSPGEYFISAITRRRGAAAINPVVTQQQTVPQRGGGGRGLAPMISAQQQNEETYAPTYFPGTAVPESATAVAVSPAGDVRGIDFTIRPTVTVSVKGQAIIPVSADANPPAAPPAGSSGRGTPAGRGGRGSINVMLTRVSSAGFSGPGMLNGSRTAVRSDGGFEISNVIPGSYNLTAIAQQNGAEYSARMRIEVGDSGVDNLNIALRPGITITGRMFIDRNLPSGFKVSQLRVAMQPAEDSGMGGRNSNAQVADDGSFTLQGVSPLTYRVRVMGLPSGAYVMAGRVGGDDAVNRPFVITGDRDVALQLQVGFSAGRVTGTVVDDKGNPYPGALATLIPDEPARLRSDLYFSIPSDQYGHFTFANVPPGGYKLFAWDDIPGDAYQDPEFIRRYEGRGIAVKVDNGAAVDQQVGITRQ